MPWTQQNVAKLANELIAELKVTEPPVNVEMIAEHLGAIVSRRPNAPDISGFLYRANGEAPLIGISEDDAPVRQRFTIAHEIGHMKLHESEQGQDGEPDLWLDRSFRVTLRATGQDGRGGQEREANWFAAELLMPEDMVRATATELSKKRQATEDSLISSLANTFEVSRTAMSYRLLNLGLLSSF